MRLPAFQTGVHHQRDAPTLRCERGRAFHPSHRRRACVVRPSSWYGGELALSVLRGEAYAREAHDGGDRVGNGTSCAIRPALVARRIHPQGGGNVPRAAYHRRGGLGRGRTEERDHAQGGNEAQLRRRLPMRGARMLAHRGAASSIGIRQACLRTRTYCLQRVRHPGEGLDALPHSATRPDVRPRPTRNVPRRKGHVRPRGPV